MFRVLGLLYVLFTRLFHSRRDLLLENLALRQQLLTFQRQKSRPRLSVMDRLFWVAARKLWSKWKQALLYVTPETVARWHRAGFRLYWSWLSRHRKVLGRKPTGKQLRSLIFQMVAENPTWGAPHIHGELLKLGFDVSERTISRWILKSAEESGINTSLEGIPREPSRGYCCHGFLHRPNHHFRRALLLLRDSP
jgi:hypothetical protein